MAKAPFKFDLGETFRHLSKPPIVEAIIHWQARSQKEWEAEGLRAELSKLLPEYTTCDPMQQLQVDFAAEISEDEKPPLTRHQHQWHGYRLATKDNKYIAQFTRDGLAVSRRQPYQDWEEFSAEAKRVWQVFTSVAQPVDVQRLGVRFINRLESATFENLGDFLPDPPTCPSNLPLNELFYQSSFTVPGQPFGVRVIKLMQRPVEGQTQNTGLFLDFDVYTETPLSRPDEELDDSLKTMRWLKNKVFFDLLTDKAIALYR
ncbi:MAG TPA: TIGR04255 family protein [Gemmataceae bacterium]|jgi:uncharacterized protein (TIGR04255 family)|nr:TIGR04255 family protein [Gemmataceae bacterium]